jgi:hypothetical protein
MSTAKKEALALVQSGLDSLKALGLSFDLVEDGQKRGKSTKRSGAGKGAIKDAACAICKFKTNPPHDATCSPRAEAEAAVRRPGA